MCAYFFKGWVMKHQVAQRWTLGMMLCVGLAQAQTVQKDYPNHPIRMVVPYVAGGPMDFIGRTLNQKMAPSLGQNFVIDNRAGAGGAIGTGVVAKSAPDGYTLLNTSSSHASLPVVSPSLSYDPVKDFTPITLVANSVGFVVAVGPSVKANTLQEFIADAKARPEKLNYGSGGVGNVMQFAAEFFNTSAGTKINHVPYKGVGEAITDLMAGRIDVCIGSATALWPLVKSGKLRALAITGKTRWAMMPDVPTVDEAGVKGFVYTPWYGLWYPAGTPTEYVTRMRQEVAKALEDPEVKRSFAEQGYVTVGSTPAEFAKVIAEEIEANKRLATKINFAP
jgi:tripartite-type tricarboxylate transporter receptor subunit TctC